VLTLAGNEVRPAHRREFRVLVAARRTGLGQVRAYLAADILRRLSERSRLTPTVIDLLPDHEDDLRAEYARLNIHPPRHTLTPPVTEDQLAGLFPDGIREPVFDVGLTGGVGGRPPTRGLRGSSPGLAELRGSSPGLAERTAPGLADYWIEVAGSADGTGEESEHTLRERHGPSEEPLAVRMMLMTHEYGAPVGYGADLDGAAKTLARWRELVARWAQSPSGPLSRRYADAVTAAIAADLDTAAALREMAALADDPGEPDGVKFETFAAADMLLGLDLARDVGKLFPRNE
jgi:hypothetical protein